MATTAQSASADPFAPPPALNTTTTATAASGAASRPSPRTLRSQPSQQQHQQHRHYPVSSHTPSPTASSPSSADASSPAPSSLDRHAAATTLLHSPARSYGTASDHSDDAATTTQSVQSAVVIARSPLHDARTTNTTASGTGENSPLCLDGSPLSRAAVDGADAAVRVNDLLAGRAAHVDAAAPHHRHQQPQHGVVPRAVYTERPAEGEYAAAGAGLPDAWNTVGGGGGAAAGAVPAAANVAAAAADPPPPPPSSTSSLSELVLRRLRNTSLLQFLWVLLLVVMLLVGNACQVIFLNFWIRQFPVKNKSGGSSSASCSGSSSTSSGAAPERAEALESSYTTFVLSAALFSVFFIVLLIGYWLWRRPSLAFVKEGAGWRLLLGIGAMDTLNSGMAIYAAAHTPEVLQALFVSLVPIYSAFFTKWLLKDPRNYANVYVVISFALIMAGVGLASLFSYAATHRHDSVSGGSADGGSGGVSHTAARHGFVATHTPTFLFNFFADEAATSAATRDKQLWCLIFFLSVPPTVLLNVLQTIYMIRYTESDDQTAYLLAHEADAEDTTVRTSRRGSEVVRTEETRRSTRSSGYGSRNHGDYEGHHGSGGSEDGGDDATHHTNGGTQLRQPDSPTHSPHVSSGSSVDAEETLIEHQHRLHVPAHELLLHGEDTTVKLVMLAADTTLQALMAFFLMPMDALPWFGGSDSIGEVWENLGDGAACVLHCPRNLRYGILYSMGFVLVYIAAAYLNRYSVTLCSMVSQLSGPITALVLIAFPSLNLTGDAAPWYVSVFAVVLLSLGTVMYVYWDETTGEEKAMGEMQLKWAMMEEQTRRHRPANDDENNDGREGHGNGSEVSSSSHHRRSRTRRYRRRRQSSYVVVVDHDPDVPRRTPQ